MKTPVIYICLSAMLLMSSFGTHAQNKYIDSLKKVLPTQKADSNKVKTLINLSESYKFFAPDSALAYGQRALSLSEKLNFDPGIFWSIVAINKALYLLGNYALELDYAFKAYPLGTKLNDPQAFGWSNGMMGDCYSNLGEYSTALNYYRPRFTQMTGELKAIVTEEGPTQVLSYDCYFKDLDTGEYLITEAYANEAALLSHLKLIAPVSTKYQIPMEIIRFELCGELAEVTLTLFRDTYDRCEHYGFRI